MSKTKKQMFCIIHGYETKEISSGDLVKGGYIATTHLDSGFYDDIRGVYVRDRIAKETLDSWAKEINEAVPRANKMSVNHQRDKHVAGVMIKGTAHVDSLPDGNYGLYADTLVDKTKENYDDTKYRIDKNLLDSYSIEFTTRDPSTQEYLPGAVEERPVDGGLVRTLLPGTILEGATFASQPMNENAVMIKELNTSSETPKTETKEVPTMEEEDKQPEAPKEEPKVEAEKSTTVKVETKEISAEDFKILKEAKATTAKENKEKEMSEMKEQIMTEIKEQLAKVEVESKVMKNDTKFESKECKEYKEAIVKDSKVPMDMQFKIAGNMADSIGLFANGEAKVRKSNIFEVKALGITTNQNTDTDYLLSAAELSDVFDPVIYNGLNQNTLAWNLLAKDDFSNKGNNQVQFTLKTAANTTASAYTGDSVTTGNVTRLKYMTKFKKYQVGVAISGDMIAAARGGPIGDVFAREVADSTDDLMAVMNVALFAEVGLETVAGIIGFEYITDNSGNATLYNLTRSTANRLSPDANGDTYINGAAAIITKANLRAAKRQALEEGANLNNLVFITNPVQGDLFRGIYDDIQRTAPTSSKFGFEGRPEFDGIAIFEDKDCNSDDWFLVDLETHRIAMWVPPTLEMLGKSGDLQEGFIKTYFCTYNRAPRRMVQIYGNATS